VVLVTPLCRSPEVEVVRFTPPFYPSPSTDTLYSISHSFPGHSLFTFFASSTNKPFLSLQQNAARILSFDSVKQTITFPIVLHHLSIIQSSNMFSRVLLSALALLVSAACAQSSYPTASPVSLTASGAPYPMPNSTVTYGPTGTGSYPSSIDQPPSSSYASAAASSSAANLAGAGSGFGSGSGSCGPATVTETAYQTVYTTVTASSITASLTPSSSTPAIATETSTSTFYQTIQVVNATSTPSSSAIESATSTTTEVAVSGSGTNTAASSPTSQSVIYQTAIVSPLPMTASAGSKHKRSHIRRF